VTSVSIPCFGLCHFKQTIPKVCIIKAISYNPMKTTNRVNDQTISVHYFISQPVDDSVNCSNYKHRYTHMAASNKYRGFCLASPPDIFFISKLIIIDWSITLCDVTPKSRILIVIKLIILITLVTNL
jgi:hypothetical protein